MAEPKTIEKRNSVQFAAICDALFQSGMKVRFRAHGDSMQPNLRDGDAVVVAPAGCNDLETGDVALTLGEDGFRVHRILRSGRVASQAERPSPSRSSGSGTCCT